MGCHNNKVLKGDTRFYAVRELYSEWPLGTVVQSDGTVEGTKTFKFPYSDYVTETYILDDELHFLANVLGEKGHQKIYALTKDGRFLQKYEQRESDTGMAIAHVIPAKNGKVYIHSTTTMIQNGNKSGIGELWRINLCPYAVSITSTTDFSLCQGSTSELAAILTGGSGNYTYKWSNGGTANKLPLNRPVNTLWS